MSIAGYAGWPAYDTFLIVLLSGRPVYDPNPLRPNPNPEKPVSGSCRVRGLGRTLTPLVVTHGRGHIAKPCKFWCSLYFCWLISFFFLVLIVIGLNHGVAICTNLSMIFPMLTLSSVSWQSLKLKFYFDPYPSEDWSRDKYKWVSCHSCRWKLLPNIVNVRPYNLWCWRRQELYMQTCKIIFVKTQAFD